MNKLTFILLFFTISSTYCSKISPKIEYSVHQEFIQNLASSCSEFTQEEKTMPFALEFQIAKKFAQDLDLYQAIQCFKRAKFLLEPQQTNRLEEIEYNIILSYYFAKRYDDVVESFEDSSLFALKDNFFAYQDLLTILFESYNKEKHHEKAQEILHLLSNVSTKKSSLLELSSAIEHANTDKIDALCKNGAVIETLNTFFKTFKQEASEEQKQDMLLYLQNPKEFCLSTLKNSLNQEQSSALEHLSKFSSVHKESTEKLTTYKNSAKSSFKAGALNAVLPGLGYLYLGQKQSAFTAFCLNSLFIASAWHFYKIGNIPGALITLSFESGWYTGGILGAKENAKLYNERLYETLMKNHMKKNNLFPITMLSYGF